MKENFLDSKVFQDELDFKTLENILEMLDHVTPKKVSRSDFAARKGNFLVETGEDKFGKQYDLFLPEDLVHGELLHLIDFLSRKFGIENYTPYGRIVTKTKVMIGVILRGMGEEKGEKYLQELAQNYSLSPEFIQRLQSQKEGGDKMSFSEAKEIIQNIKQKRTDNNDEKVGENEDDMVLGFEELKELYGEEFDLTFFRKGVNMLRLGMMTITQAEQKALKKRQIGEREVISFNKWTIFLDQQERLLREKIGVDDLKKDLLKVRISGDQGKINKAELKAVKRILKVLIEYPYVSLYNDFGSQPKKILDYKEIHCVGFCILGHAFLSELGIKHNGLRLPGHVTIEIIIGGKSYYFDATANNLLYNMKLRKSGEEYNDILIFCLGGIVKKKGYRVKIENMLLASIYNNNSKLQVKMVLKAFSLDSSFVLAKNNIKVMKQNKY